MDQSSFEISKWYEALTLNERIQSLAKIVPNESLLANQPIDQKLAEKRLQRWRAQKPFENFSNFTRRLEASGLSENDFFRLLGFSSWEVVLSAIPTWLL
jgi:hypothetical protein